MTTLELNETVNVVSKKNNSILVEFSNGVRVRGESRWSLRNGTKKTRVYAGQISDEAVSDFSGIPLDSLKYSVRGEDAEMDRLFDKWNRSMVKFMRENALQALNGLKVENQSMKFSRNAGCSSCPCSPGFVAEGENTLVVDGQEYVVTDIFAV